MKIIRLMDELAEALKDHPPAHVLNMMPPSQIEHQDIIIARSNLRLHVEKLLSQSQTFSDPSSRGYQQIILELTYFNTRSLLGG